MDVAHMMAAQAHDGDEADCSEAVAVAGVVGLAVVVTEMLYFRQQVLRDGGGLRAWLSLLVSLAGVAGLLHDAGGRSGRVGAGAVKLMAALMVAHVAVPLIIGPPPPPDTEDEDDDDMFNSA